MTTFAHTYKPEGSDEDVTIQVPVPEGMLTAEAVAQDFMPKSGFQSELSRRTASILSNKRDDAEYKVELLKHWGIDPDAKPASNPDGGPSIEDRLATERTSWETTVLTPVKDTLSAAEVTISDLLGRSLDAEILQAATSVKEAFRNAPRPGAKPAIVGTVDSLFGYDEEHKAFFVKDGDSFAFTKTPVEGRPPYMGVSEYMSEFLGRSENADLLDDRRQRGPNINADGTPNREGSAAYTLTRTEANDPAKYRAAKEAAKKAGQVFPVVVDD